MLAILLISVKYKRVFNSIKHLVTNSRNCLKANIIKANKCLKSWYGRPEAKAFKRGVNPNVNDLYKEEAKAKAKATAEAAAKKDSNTQDDTDQNTGEQKGKQAEEAEEEDEDDEDDEDDSVKYIVVDD